MGFKDVYMAKNCPYMKQVPRYGIQAETEAKEFYMKWSEDVEDEAEKMELLSHSEMELDTKNS